jgi:hypothetical protein
VLTNGRSKAKFITLKNEFVANEDAVARQTVNKANREITGF